MVKIQQARIVTGHIKSLVACVRHAGGSLSEAILLWLALRQLFASIENLFIAWRNGELPSPPPVIPAPLPAAKAPTPPHAPARPCAPAAPKSRARPAPRVIHTHAPRRHAPNRPKPPPRGPRSTRGKRPCRYSARHLRPNPKISTLRGDADARQYCSVIVSISQNHGVALVRNRSCSCVNVRGPSATSRGGPDSACGLLQQSTVPRLRVQNGGRSGGGSCVLQYGRPCCIRTSEQSIPVIPACHCGAAAAQDASRNSGSRHRMRMPPSWRKQMNRTLPTALRDAV